MRIGGYIGTPVGQVSLTGVRNPLFPYAVYYEERIDDTDEWTDLHGGEIFENLDEAAAYQRRLESLPDYRNVCVACDMMVIRPPINWGGKK